MGKTKKITVSKIVLFLPYVFLSYEVWLMTRMILPMIEANEYNYNIIQYFGIEFFIPTVGLCMVAQTTYSIKSKAEYLANVMIYNIYKMIDIQEAYPKYQIYDTNEIRKDAEATVKPYKDKISEMDKAVLNETPSK